LAKASSRLTFRPDIQGLRAIAVSLVVLAHADVPGFAGGFIGVDVFFVLSGYLITGLLLSEHIATGSIRYGRFLARRLRRLLPAMLAMLVLVLIIASVVLTAYEMRMQGRSFPYAASWISNFFFAFAERDYFDALQAKDLFLHTWSLGVEEQFYLLWPWLVLLFAGLKTRDKTQPASGSTVLVAFAIVSAFSLAISLYLSTTVPILSFYMMPARIWQFALGASVFVALHLVVTADRRFDPLVGAVGLIGMLLILASSMLLSPSMNYPGWLALFPSVGAAFVIAAGKVLPQSGLTAVLASRPFTWVGDRSYSIYLWHWPILILGGSLGVSGSVAGKVLLVALAVVIASLCYRYIELPFWKGRYKDAAPVRVVQYAAAAVLLSVSVFVLLDRNVYAVPSNGTAAEGYDPRFDWPREIYRPGQSCDTGILDAQIIPCPMGNKDGERLAVLWGDSIGAMWAPAIAGVFASPDWQLLVLTKSACAIVDKTYYYDKVGGPYEVCTEWREKTLEYLQMIEPDVVVVGSSAYYDFTPAEWVDRSSSVLGRLAKNAGQVVLIPSTPRLSFNGPSCLEDPWRFSFRLLDGERECEEARVDEITVDVAGYLAQVADAFPNVELLKLDDLVCPGGLCAAQTVDGVAVFRDEIHVTASFATSVVPELRRRLDELGIRFRSEKPEPDK